MAEKRINRKVVIAFISFVAFAMITIYLADTYGSVPWPSRNASEEDVRIATELASTFTGIESGIKSLAVDGSFIYVELVNSISSSDASSMSRIWARRLSERYHFGRSCTAYTTRGCRVLAKITYSKLDGYIDQSRVRNLL